jgi:hypothetical protein
MIYEFATAFPCRQETWACGGAVTGVFLGNYCKQDRHQQYGNVLRSSSADQKNSKDHQEESGYNNKIHQERQAIRRNDKLCGFLRPYLDNRTIWD